jgi:hypothetical protein
MIGLVSKQANGLAITLFELAERQGFEPWITYKAIPDFESGAFDHSAIFPFLQGQNSSSGQAF